MGNPFSKSPDPLVNGSSNDATAATPAAAAAAAATVEYVSELNSYEAACLQDPELQSFDTTLQRRASHVISALASGGVDVHSLSFDTLREVGGCLLDMNQEVVKVILEYKKDIWKNAELFELVEEYFQSSLQTLDFCTAMEKCLKRARDSQLFVLVAIKRFEEEEEEPDEKVASGKGGGRGKYERTLEELQHFKKLGDPFDEEFFRAFQSVYTQQVLMLEKLQKKKKKLDKKFKTMHAWRKVSTVIFVSAFTVVLICSVVAAAVTAPAMITALLTSATAAMGPVGKWLNALWKDYLEALKGQQELLDTMQVGTYVTVSDLDDIRILVERLESVIINLLRNVDFAMREEEAVRLVIEEMKQKLDGFMKSVEDLGKQADRCSRDIRKARTVVLQRIIRHPN